METALAGRPRLGSVVLNYLACLGATRHVFGRQHILNSGLASHSVPVALFIISVGYPPQQIGRIRYSSLLEVYSCPYCTIGGRYQLLASTQFGTH